MKLGIIGDTHANTDFLTDTIGRLGKLGVQSAIVTGDFGIFPAFASTSIFLDEVNAAAKEAHLTLYAVRGNHDDPDWWDWQTKNNPTHKGFGMVRSRILLSPTVNYWTWANKRFLGVGGAVSIDKIYRLEQERFGHFANNDSPSQAPIKRTLWWPGEVLSDEQLATVDVERVDYLITHDCSDRTPFRDRLKPDPDSQIHRQKIDEVIARSKPTAHFHGHMHTKYEWMNRNGGETIDPDTGIGSSDYTMTYGLECDGQKDSWGVLDVPTGEFRWQGLEPGEDVT